MVGVKKISLLSLCRSFTTLTAEKCFNVSPKIFSGFRLTKGNTQSRTVVSGLAAISPSIPSIPRHESGLIHICFVELLIWFAETFCFGDWATSFGEF